MVNQFIRHERRRIFFRKLSTYKDATIVWAGPLPLTQWRPEATIVNKVPFETALEMIDQAHSMTMILNNFSNGLSERLLSAMHRNCCVISSTNNLIEKIFTHKKDILLLDPTFENLDENIQLSNDPATRKQIANAAFNKISEDYSVSSLVTRIFSECGINNRSSTKTSNFDIIAIEKDRIINKATQYLSMHPRTVTADQCERSEGGMHDFYSEGDYWWPDPENSENPYVRRDGLTNPDNFIAHRQSIIRLSEITATLTSAYMLTYNEKYAAHAIKHITAWFIDKETRMNPSLLYGQAVKGRCNGRGIGIIDTLHLTEVARSIKLLCASPSFTLNAQVAAKFWFFEYLTWINTHPYGMKEKIHPNNHGVCWSLQAAAFADLIDDQNTMVWVRNQFKTVYLAQMMNKSGGFPAELARTKSFSYSLFMIDALAGVALLASTPEDDLLSYQLPDGRSMKQGASFIAPYIKDKSSWPNKPDVMYWDK